MGEGSAEMTDTQKRLINACRGILENYHREVPTQGVVRWADSRVDLVWMLLGGQTPRIDMRELGAHGEMSTFYIAQGQQPANFSPIVADRLLDHLPALEAVWGWGWVWGSSREGEGDVMRLTKHEMRYLRGEIKKLMKKILRKRVYRRLSMGALCALKNPKRKRRP